MAAIPDDKVNEVRERASIHEVVAEYVNLKKAGANYTGLCPFHGEKTPSFNVNPARGIFHCFGCGVGGDVFAFIMRIEGIAFPEAVRLLAKRSSVVIEDRPLSAVEKKKVDEWEQLHAVMEAAAGYYTKLLLEKEAGEPARRYLEGRGALTAVKAGYRMGYAGESWEGLSRHLEQQKISLALAEKTGLIRQRSGGGYYDLFRNRLLFYITDYRGRVIAVGGRVLDNSLPKYINSPESPIYHKSDALFGIDSARHAMRESGIAIVVEGYFDHLSLHNAGIKNVVATCGTALTPGHLKLIRRYADKVYTLFDADSAGKKATFRALDLFLEEGLPAYVVEIPGGEDPDTFVRKAGVEQFRDNLSKAKPIFQCYIREVVANLSLGSVEGKVRGVEELAPKLAKLTNLVEQANYLQEVARILDVDPVVLRKRMGNQAPVRAQDVVPAKKQVRKGQDAEEMLLLLMVRFPRVVARVRGVGARALFREKYLPLAEAILTAEGEETDLPAILEKVTTAPEERAKLSALFVDDAHLHDIDVDKALEQCLLAREREDLKEASLLKQELARLDSDSERYWEVLKELDSLRNKKSRLL